MEDTAMQPRPLKLTIKFKNDKNLSKCSAIADDLNNGAVESSISNSHLPEGVGNSSQDQVDLCSEDVMGNHNTEDEDDPPPEKSNQLVPYDSADNVDESENEPGSVGSNKTPKVPVIGAFTVQCADCFKWRLIPTKEKYEKIREHIIEQPFSCETAREWKPEISCEDPPDILQDSSRLWAIDKPSIAQPPPGWQRLLRIRGEGSSKFADVYYVSPSGKRLRSMVEVQRHLNENVQYVEEGVNMAQFSFQIPRPLNNNYVRKRQAPSNGGDPVLVEPIAWRSPDVDTDLQLTLPQLSQSAKKKKKKSARRFDGGQM